MGGLEEGIELQEKPSEGTPKLNIKQYALELQCVWHNVFVLPLAQAQQATRG